MNTTAKTLASTTDSAGKRTRRRRSRPTVREAALRSARQNWPVDVELPIPDDDDVLSSVANLLKGNEHHLDVDGVRLLGPSAVLAWGYLVDPVTDTPRKWQLRVLPEQRRFTA